MLDPFGPLTIREQVNDIVQMFDEEDGREYRPVIGKVIKKYGYDISLFVFGQLRNEIHKPANVWAYSMFKAKQKSVLTMEKSNKQNWTKKLSDGGVTAMLDALFLEGKVLTDDYDKICSIEDARALLGKMIEREENGRASYDS